MMPINTFPETQPDSAFEDRQKNPLMGLMVLDKESDKILSQNKIKKESKTLYEFLDPLYDHDTLVKNYKLITYDYLTSDFVNAMNQLKDNKQHPLSLFFLSLHGSNTTLPSGKTVSLCVPRCPNKYIAGLSIKSKFIG